MIIDLDYLIVMAAAHLPITTVHDGKTRTMPHEIFSLIRLDNNQDSEDFKKAYEKLRPILNHLKKFHDVKECQQYIEHRSQQVRIIMIVSGRLGSEIVPSIHELRQVTSIYVYCMNKAKNKKWADRYAKVKILLKEICFVS